MFFHKTGLKDFFFGQPEGGTNTEEMLSVFRRHALEEIFQVMRVAVKYRKGQRQLKKIALHLEYLRQTSYLRPSVP